MLQPAWLKRWRSSKSPCKDAPTPGVEEPPLPYQQIFVLAIVRLCEPIAYMSIFPYVYHMVESFHITESADQIAFYAGMITSSFTFAEFTAGAFWGRMSDQYGRKLVLMIGLIGTAISMIIFGFAPNLATAMVARALGGVLNGNLGVIYTTVSEISTTKDQQREIISFIICTWPLGTIIGSALGGALALPCENYPSFFSRNTLWDKFPFLLPNLVCVSVLIVGISTGCLFLKESHPRLKHRRDRGIELGQWLMSGSRVYCNAAGEKYNKVQPHDQIDDIAESSTCSTPVDTPAADRDLEGQTSVAKIYTPQIILLLFAYGLLAYHSVSFDQLMPIFLSTPESHDNISLPFKFTGGLGLTTKTIGFIFASQGAYTLVAQLWGYPMVSKIFGDFRCLRFVVLVWPPIYFLVPYIVLLPVKIQALAVYVPLILKMSLHVVAFPAVNLLIMNSAPSDGVRGTVNGTAASVANLSRAFGATFTGLLHSKGLENGYSILSWWTCGIICLIGAIQSFWLVPPESKDSKSGAANTNKSQNPEERPLLRPLSDEDTFAAGTFSQSSDHASQNSRSEA